MKLGALLIIILFGHDVEVIRLPKGYMCEKAAERYNLETGRGTVALCIELESEY